VLSLCSSLAWVAGAQAAEPALGPPLIEIRVRGDEMALARVRSAADELFSRVRVRALVRAAPNAELETDDAASPWLLAHVDLRVLTQPVVDVEEARSGQELTHRTVLDGTSLETGVEATMHIVYSAVEAALSLHETQAANAPPPPAKFVAPRATPRSSAPRLGLDVGALGRVTSFGGGRFLPGGGAMVELGADWGAFRTGLMLLGAAHETTDVAFGDGYSTLRPLALRLIPVLDARLTREVEGAFGLGFGLDEFALGVGRAPSPMSMMSTTSPTSMMSTTSPSGSPLLIRAHTGVIWDPVFSALLGLRLPLGPGAFASLLGSLDVGVGSRSLLLIKGRETASVFELPQFRAGVVLAASFTARGAQRFTASARTE
jgi:hypothetical protein